MRMEHLDDWALVSRSAQNDEAFAVLFRRYKDFVYRLATGFAGDPGLGDEITQEVFVRVYEGRRRWQARARFRTYLYRVVLNTSRELLRKRDRERTMLDKAKREAAVQQAAPAGHSNTPDLEQVLATLPDRQRESLMLRYYEKLSIKETAKVMGCRQGTVKSHLHRAMKHLRQQLKHPEEAQ